MLSDSRRPKPPKPPPAHLSADSKKAWRAINDEYELLSEALPLLQTALENWDRAQQARKLVSSEGLVIKGRRHPAIDIEKQCYGLFMRAWRQLGLNMSPPGEPGRPAAEL